MHAAEIDTVIDTRLVVDSATALAARRARDERARDDEHPRGLRRARTRRSRKVVFKSSAHYYGCERDDPSFFTEEMRRPHPPRTRLESDIVEAEDAVQDFAARNPSVTVTTLRFCNGLGPDLDTRAQRAARAARGARASSASTRATSSSTRTTSSARCTTRSLNDLPGIHNVAPDGVLALSEIASLLGKPFAPLLPPWGTALGDRGTGLLGI